MVTRLDAIEGRAQRSSASYGGGIDDRLFVVHCRTDIPDMVRWLRVLSLEVDIWGKFHASAAYPSPEAWAVIREMEASE